MNGPRTYGPRRPLPVDPAGAALPEELQRLLRIVAMAANEAPSTREALRCCLDSVCLFTGWPLGHAFVREDQGEEYFSSGVWHVEPEETFAHFRRMTAETVLRLGEGLVGRVAESVEPVVVEAINTSPEYWRPEDGELRGFDAAFIPLVTADEPAGVLEFYFRPEDRPDQPLLEVLTMIGRQLGRVVERDRADQALRLSEALFAGIVGISSEAIVSADAAQTIVTFNRGAEMIFGYSADEEIVYLRSGTTPLLATPLREFIRSWHDGGQWFMTAHQPGDIPAGADPGVYLEAANGLEQADQTAAALQAYLAATRFWPEYWPAWVALGNRYYLQSEFVRAEHAFRQATQLAPEQAAPLHNLAWAMIKQDRGPQALPFAEAAAGLSESPHYRSALNALNDAL